MDWLADRALLRRSDTTIRRAVERDYAGASFVLGFMDRAVSVELVAAFLTDLKHAYDSVLLFEATIDGMRRAARDFPFIRYPFGSEYGWLPASRRATPRTRNWPPTAEEAASFVPRAEQLVLSAVSLNSPGLWEFLGTLNPLEVLRKYLNQRPDIQPLVALDRYQFLRRAPEAERSGRAAHFGNQKIAMD